MRVFYQFDHIETSGQFSSTQQQGYIYNANSILDNEANLFTDELFDGGEHEFTFWSERYLNNGSQNENQNNPKRVFINLWSLTEEEYKYRQSVKNNQEALDNPFAEPTVVFSNIENGIGIFSLSRIQSYLIEL